MTVEDLGVQVPTSAESYKLLLYEEGAFFKAHRDTEKTPGMFGTLVICLPSEHTGGEVHLSHDGKKMVLETGPTSQFDLSTLAWYSDVQHAIQPIKSGYRPVLTYNLVQIAGVRKPTAELLDENHSRLEKLLRTWKRDFDYLDMFVHPFEHKYTEASLRASNLKDRDGALGNYLQNVCSANGVYFFLANMTHETCEDQYGDGDDDQTTLYHVTNPSGQVIRDSMYLDHETFLPKI
ncbi:hypothetical protein K432DRAFT_469906 [Lepidopterella palustris CBS 459.81]|uniref:Prolyl 4-hydroxylase alpha subunit Fe(2+) 2OG dioxygenase domain-containing protein n=1 Tax=Lepidopterella palustris CBS 459.81 TaxID=1314670 RepID=A0A8E2J9L7_9PEZI|nr:hypothetical protein K432DRAFT_469906 [Lepidopterella palustris CBS 459.81]